MLDSVDAALKEVEERARALVVVPVQAQPQPTTGLQYLQQVYRGEIEPEGPRMRAAIAALPFESPKLSVVANIGHHELGDRLERAIARSMQSHGFALARPVIDAEPVEPLAKPDHSLVPPPPTRGGFKRRF
jgi:hypothetical protein